VFPRVICLYALDITTEQAEVRQEMVKYFDVTRNLGSYEKLRVAEVVNLVRYVLLSLRLGTKFITDSEEAQPCI